MKITLKRKISHKDYLKFYINKSHFEMGISSYNLDIDLYIDKENEWYMAKAYIPDDDIIDIISDQEFPTRIDINWYNIVSIEETKVKKFTTILDEEYGIQLIIHRKTDFDY